MPLNRDYWRAYLALLDTVLSPQSHTDINYFQGSQNEIKTDMIETVGTGARPSLNTSENMLSTSFFAPLIHMNK